MNADELRGTASGPGITNGTTNWIGKRARKAPAQPQTHDGTAMRYDIAEVVDPLIHVVAKIRKDAVALLR